MSEDEYVKWLEQQLQTAKKENETLREQWDMCGQEGQEIIAELTQQNKQLKADLKLESERNKSFENVRQLLYSEIKKLSSKTIKFDGIDEMVAQNKQMREAINYILDNKAKSKPINVIQNAYTST